MSPIIQGANSTALPWRRANVRHTSNELYADIVETLTVTLAPSGRPLAAFANGSIAFTCKVSGVPDILVNISSPSGKHNLASMMELPVFHPCVRLNRWKESPGELSFVPPDGRFILAGYEVDLLPFTLTSETYGNMATDNLKLPVNVEVRTGQGPMGAEFEVRLQVNKIFGTPSSTSGGLGFGRGGGGAGGRLGQPQSGSPQAPTLDGLVITVPLPPDVRNLSDIRPSRGDASFNPGDRVLEWQIPTKDMSGPTSHLSLRCSVVGNSTLMQKDEAAATADFEAGLYSYSEEEPYQDSSASSTQGNRAKDPSSNAKNQDDSHDSKKVAQNKMLMPTSASVSFSVKGWLASGLKIDSIVVDTRKSRGLGEGVKPYKGVKYLTVSKGGVEIRC